jgi:hypothetical protein
MLEYFGTNLSRILAKDEISGPSMVLLHECLGRVFFSAEQVDAN